MAASTQPKCNDGKVTAEQTVIVIEDDSNIADLLDTYLRGAGFRVLLAAAGERGLELITQHSPALEIGRAHV